MKVLTPSQVVLALSSGERYEDQNSFDRARTMFLDKEGKDTLKLVDSTYLLHNLETECLRFEFLFLFLRWLIPLKVLRWVVPFYW